jgi:transaldolase
VDIVHEMQAHFRARKAQGATFDTEVLAASFLTAKEALRLTGIDRQTLSPAVLKQLKETTVGEEETEIIQTSLAVLETKQKAIVADQAKPIEWLEDGSEGLAKLQKALTGERTTEMLKDALGVFSKAEEGLKDLFRPLV